MSDLDSKRSRKAALLREVRRLRQRLPLLRANGAAEDRLTVHVERLTACQGELSQLCEQETELVLELRVANASPRRCA